MAFPALHQLYVTLRSKPEPERITTEEYDLFRSCYLKILRTCGFASGIGGSLAWSASKRLTTKLGGLRRFGVAASTATMVFVASLEWAGDRTAVSCLDHILGQDATRMQKELVNILVRYNQGEPWRWKLMSKYFYPELVYNDEADNPKMQWRRRYASAESVLSSHDTNKAKPPSSHNSSPSSPNRSILRGSNVSKTTPKLQNSSGNSDNKLAEDPFDCLFGGLETTEAVHSPANPNVSSKAHMRRKRGAHRRQRVRNREASEHSRQYEHM